jgi:hypothetical protein
MIRQMNIPAGWVANGELGALPTLLGTGQKPSDVRQLQGSMVFTFEEIESQADSIFAVEGVLDWFHLLHTRIPHVSYFLEPSPMSGALQGMLLCVLDEEARAAAIASSVPVTQPVLEFLLERMISCARFATAMGDDWERILRDFLAPIGDPGMIDSLVDAISDH